ncbi:hypothetical protein PROFUN_03224 [Planoprotostelium fungivorum]|nr:hypothetical protein PROFUN_03224 [Planoprotostelium fungivorum]
MINLLRSAQSINLARNTVSHVKTNVISPVKQSALIRSNIAEGQARGSYATWSSASRDEKTAMIAPPVTLQKVLGPFKNKKRALFWILGAVVAGTGVAVAKSWQKEKYEEANSKQDEALFPDERKQLIYDTWTVIASTPNASEEMIRDNRIIELFVDGFTDEHLCIMALSVLAAQPRFRESIAKQLPYDKIADRRFSMSDVAVAGLLSNLLSEISQDPKAIHYMDDKGVISFLGNVLQLGIPPISEKAALALNNIAKRTNSVESLLEFMDPLCDFAATKTPESHPALEVIAQLVEQRDVSNSNAFKSKLDAAIKRQKFSEGDLSKLKKTAERIKNQPTERKALSPYKVAMEGIANGAFISLVWGSLRWTIRSWRNQIRTRGELGRVLLARVPLTVLGSSLFALPFLLEHSLVEPEYRVDGISKNEQKSMISSGAVAVSHVATAYVALSIAPFSLVPGLFTALFWLSHSAELAKKERKEREE